MAVDRRKPGRLDRDRISLNGEYEAKDWAQKFGVTKDELVAAVHAVGHSARDVEKYLHERKHT